MTTPFISIYEIFLNQILDERFLKTLSLENQEMLLETALLQAVIDFDNSIIDLTFDLENKCFLNELTYEERFMLANLMHLFWVRRQLEDERKLRQQLGNRDYQIYSPANHLKELMNSDASIYKRIKRMKYNYTLKNHMKKRKVGMNGE